MMSGSVPKKLFTALITRKSRRTKGRMEKGRKQREELWRMDVKDSGQALGPKHLN